MAKYKVLIATTIIIEDAPDAEDACEQAAVEAQEMSILNEFDFEAEEVTDDKD